VIGEPFVTKLQDVNTGDIRDAIELGCRAMSNAFNADDNDIPYGGASVRPVAGLGGSSEAHSPGRHLNALLNAEDAAGIRLDEDAVEKHARAAFFSYGVAPIPLHRNQPGGRPTELQDHDIREGFHALYALTKYRRSERARRLAESSIETIVKYWVPEWRWDTEGLRRDLGVTTLTPGYVTFVSGLGRCMGPLVKFYRATGYGPALELALILKDRALETAFLEDGSYDEARFGTHCHSTTCVMSSLAQLADVTQDAPLMARVKAFYDNGLWEIRDEIGWSIETSHDEGNSGRGEANNTGDILETALILGRWGYTEYYHDAERILRCHLLPSQLRDVSFVVEPPNPDGVDGRRNVAERLRGGYGFPAPYGHEPLGIMDSSKPRVGFNLDIVGGAVGSLCEAYREVTQRDQAGHRVNMLFDHETDDNKVESPYTHSSLRVTAKRPGPLFVRVPPWVDRGSVKVAGVEAPPTFANGFFFVPQPPINWPVSFEFPLTESKITLRNPTGDVRVRLRGDEVTAMDNLGSDLTFFDPID
jgi:hypothetical protein